MNELKTFIKNNRLLFIALAIFLCVGIWFSFGAGSRTHDSGSGVHDNGERADAVRHEIGAAREQQHQIGEGLQSAESRAGKVTSSLERSASANREAASRADSIEATIEQQRAAIADCQRIARTVRERGKKAATNN